MSRFWGEGGGIMQSEVTVTMSHFVITMSRTIHMWSNTSSIHHYQRVITAITLDIMREDGKVSEYLLITTH